MKRKSLLFVWSYVFILSTIFISCKDTDNSVFGDDFDFPALTDANTIRFTVNVTGDWRQLNIVADGGRMVIDWGNGRMQKVEDPSSMAGGVTYRYGNKGSYNVRIWAEELQLIDISGLLISISDLHLGNMPGIIKLVKGLDCRFNLIRFHQIPDIPLQGVDDEKMEQFRDYLTQHGVFTTIRASRGQDIYAACGLLSTSKKIGEIREHEDEEKMNK